MRREGIGQIAALASVGWWLVITPTQQWLEWRVLKTFGSPSERQHFLETTRVHVEDRLAIRTPAP
jgi:hypothetical protein